MAAPLVTIIVPCYNHGCYVEQCLQSILDQTYKNIELIVVDDGSKDNSVDVIRAIQKQHGFKFITQTNQGLTPTLNKALGMASGKYYGVFASDDVMLPDRIEKQVAFMEEHPQFVACGGNFLAINEDGSLCEKQKKRPYRELGFEDIFCDLKPGVPAPTALVKTEAARKVGGYREDIGIEDTYLWLKLTHEIGPMAVLDDVLVKYRQHESNMHSRLPFIVDNMMKIYSEYTDHPAYQPVCQALLLNAFVKAARKNKPFAKTLLPRLNAPITNRKLLKGVFNLYFR